MENIVIKTNKFDEEWVDVGETSIGMLKVRKWIPFTEKESMARAIAYMSISEDKDSETVVVSHLIGLIREFMFIATYANVEAEIEGNETAMDTLLAASDWLSSTGLREKAYEAAEEDMGIVDSMTWDIIKEYKATYDATHSLATRVKKSFGDLLNGGSPAEILAGTEEMTAKLGEMLKVIGELKENVGKEGGIPMKGGLLDLNGLQLDIRKKEDK